MNRGILLTIFIASVAHAQVVDHNEDPASRVSSLIHQALTEKIAGAEIRIPSLQNMFARPPMSDFVEITQVRLTEDRASGVAVFEIQGKSSEHMDLEEVIQTPYQAWKKVPVASHRIYPNSKLKNEDFKLERVNVASGLAREYRGVMVPEDTRFDGLQSKQTILENQYVVTNAIERQPDVKRGDTVKLELISGDLILTTQAEVQEPALVGDRVRVITFKNKRELTGKVKADHTVEVAL